jgi:serine/threonine-protein kinase RsbT
LVLRGSEHIKLVRQAVRQRAVEKGFSLVDQTKIVTVASELARNTIHHGGGGHATLEVVSDGMRRGLRLTFEDSGPGIPDLALAMKDEYSTAGGLGLGLSGASDSQTSSRLRRPPAPGRGSSSRDGNNVHAFSPAVNDPSQPSAARLAAREAAARAGFGEEDTYRTGLVATELATNLVKHAVGGEVLVRTLRGVPRGEVEILAIESRSGDG